MLSLVAEKAKKFPIKPGVYVMRDRRGAILYIGKASILRNRVRSYFTRIDSLEQKTKSLVQNIFDIEFFVTSSEQEALILELNMIKKHRPPYNIQLKDDKSFPYIKIDIKSEWPRVYSTRKLITDGSRYFGPFANSRSVRQTLKAIKRIFRFRTCKKDLSKKHERPCLEHDINQCLAPCIGAVSKKEYAKIISQIILFLEGKQGLVVKKLEADMLKASEDFNYEKAADIRDQLQAIRSISEGHKISAVIRGNEDAIAFASEGDEACVQVFFIRSNKLIGRESFTLKGIAGEKPSNIMSNFVRQYYGASPNIPPRILLQCQIEDKSVIEEWLKAKKGTKVAITTPQRGSKKQLIETVKENAKQNLMLQKIKHLTSPLQIEQGLNELASELKLPAPPKRIEGYDISNIQGKAAVGSMVVFENGKSKPSAYRRFKIKTLSSADDFGMLREVMTRRFGRMGKTSEEKPSDSWGVMPDLVLIDGGKGQLSSAISAIDDLGVEGLNVASLAKENEEIFLPNRLKSIILPRTSPALRLLQQVRDESHRFAIGYHKKVRTKQTFDSALDSVPGIGPKRRRILLKHFGSVTAIRNASLAEIESVKGISKAAALAVKECL